MNLHIIIKIACFAFLNAMPFWSLANEEYVVEKSKTVSKTYSVSGNDLVRLDNQFGDMKVNTWNRNEVKVDISIVAKASTDEKAQQILDDIYIEEGKSSSGVSVTTKMKNGKNNWNNSKDKKNYKEMSMKIDYVVYMPASNPLDATNQFGAMTIPDLKGPVSLTSKFGSLTSGRLSQARKIDVEFGEARIESISGGKLTVKFSKGDIRQVEGNLEARFEFCDKLRVGIDNNTKDLNIRSSYSQLYLNSSSNLSSAIDIKTSFGDFNNQTSFNIKKQGDDEQNKYGPKFDKQFNGMAGAGNNKLKVNADFGNVTLGHNLNVDFSSTKKSKVI